MSEKDTASSGNATPEDTTHFGYQTVATGEKQKRVADVFHSVAAKYDLMNDLMSFGVHRLWKKYTIELSGVRRGTGYLILPVAPGPELRFCPQSGPDGLVVLADINDSMLKVGRDRLADRGIAGNLETVQANASIYLSDNHFDVITMAFGLRNVTHKEKALAEFNRVLKPGGRLLVLEFSKPRNDLLSKAYDVYSFKALPLIGRAVTGDPDSYQYLAESIRMHPDQDTLKSMMEDAGLVQVRYHNLTGGIVALHRGVKA